MKKTRKLLCILLALVMVVGLLPGMAFAADVEEADNAEADVEVADTADVVAVDAETEGLVGDIVDTVGGITLPTYAVYVKTNKGVPAVGAVVTLTNQVTGEAQSYTADFAGKFFIPKSLTGVYTVSASWTSPMFGIKYVSIPGLTWSLGVKLDVDTIKVYPIPNIGLNYTDHTAYIHGYPNGTVQPTGTLTRAEACQILYGIMLPGSVDTTVKKNYSDVSANFWAAPAIAAMTNAGVVVGTSTTTFSPDAPVTRGQLFTMIGRMYVGEFTTDGLIGNIFTDIGAKYYSKYIDLLYNLGLVNGDGNGTVRPEDPITRAEAVVLINTLLMRFPTEQSAANCSGVKNFPDNKAGSYYYYHILEAANAHDYTVDVNLNIFNANLGFVETWTKLK